MVDLGKGTAGKSSNSSQQLDGMRAYWTGKALYSRQGNVIHAPKWWTKDLPHVPLDGELWCGRGLFQKTVSIVKQQKVTGIVYHLIRQDSTEDDWKYVTYLVFDAPTHAGTYEVALCSEILSTCSRNEWSF